MVVPFKIEDFTKMVDSLYERYGYALHEVYWQSWPEAYSSTAGPHKDRIAGRAITTFQKFAFTFPDGKLVTYCDGVWE